LGQCGSIKTVGVLTMGITKMWVEVVEGMEESQKVQECTARQAIMPRTSTMVGYILLPGVGRNIHPLSCLQV